MLQRTRHLLAALLGAALLAAALPGAASALDAVPGQVVVKFDAGSTAQTAQVAGDRPTVLKVRDVRADHARLVALGVEEGAAPMRLGSVARISFIRDPAGNWIELSQRASLVGDLGPDDA